MKAYVVVTGAIFALLTVVHLWRLVAEAGHPATNPWFILTTLLAAAFSGWACFLLRKLFR